MSRQAETGSPFNFDLFLGIDYSGAQTPASRLPALQVFAARGSDAACEKWFSPAASNNGKPCNWTRAEIARTLLDQARQGVRFLAGIDHGLFPACGPGTNSCRTSCSERTGQSTEFRFTERWTSSAKSVIQ